MSSPLTHGCTAPRANQGPAELGGAGMSAMGAWYGAGSSVAGKAAAAATGNQVKDSPLSERIQTAIAAEFFASGIAAGVQRTHMFEPRKRRE